MITIPASDGTAEKATYVRVPKAVFKELSEIQGASNSITELNQRALQTRADLRAAYANKDLKEVITLRDRLKAYNNQRAVMALKASDPNSVARDEEVARVLKTEVDYTAGFMGKDTPLSGDIERAIKANSNDIQRIAAARIRGVTGRIVLQGSSPNPGPGGGRVTTWIPTDKTYIGPPITPEKKGSKKK